MIRKSKKYLSGNKRGGGFTLIELMVVVATISLLIAILLPALGKAKALAMRLVCKGNLRQITFAWQAYLEDFDGRFYRGRNADVDFGGWEGIHAIGYRRPLNSYLSSPDTPESEGEAKVFKCGADKARFTGSGLSVYSSHGTSYRTNLLLIGPSRIPPLPSIELTSLINNSLKNLRLGRVDNHSRLLLVGDNPWVTQWWPTSKQPPAWHGRCCYSNLAYLDGHVEFIKIRKGLYLTDEYTVLPSHDLYSCAREVQVEKPCE